MNQEQKKIYFCSKFLCNFNQANWGEWNLPYSVCDFYLAMDVVCSTSSIFHLVVISVDRYFAVTSPIFYNQYRRNTTPAKIIIFMCWSSSLAIGLPIMFGLNHRPNTEDGMEAEKVKMTLFYIFSSFISGHLV